MSEMIQVTGHDLSSFLSFFMGLHTTLLLFGPLSCEVKKDQKQHDNKELQQQQ